MQNKQVSYRAHSKRSNGSTHTLETRLKDKLSTIATRHLVSNKTTSYKYKIGTSMACTQIADHMLPISTRIRFICIKINPT